MRCVSLSCCFGLYFVLFGDLIGLLACGVIGHVWRVVAVCLDLFVCYCIDCLLLLYDSLVVMIDWILSFRWFVGVYLLFDCVLVDFDYYFTYTRLFCWGWVGVC